MTKDEALGIWTYLGAHCSGARLDEYQLELRAVETASWDATFDQAMAVAQTWVRAAKWMPSTGELYQALFPSASPGELVAEVHQLVQDYGWPSAREAQLAASPAAWELVRQLGGWQAVCESSEVHFRAHALKIAPIILERQDRQAPGALPPGRPPEIEPPEEDIQ